MRGKMPTWTSGFKNITSFGETFENEALSELFHDDDQSW
jgi:hypothetical protein